MKTFLKLTAGGLLLLIGLLATVVFYFNRHDFPPFLIRHVEAQLLQRGLTAHFKSIRLDILRGVIATDAALADARKPDRVLARIDRLQIDWDWHRLLNGESAINDLRIANATVVVPTPADEIGSEMFTASEASATFRFSEVGAIQVDQLTGIYCGIRMRMSGRIKLRSDALAGRKKPSSQNHFVFVTKALRELNNLHGVHLPQLDVNFDLDLADPVGSHVTAKLAAAEVTYRKINVETLAVAVEMRDGAVDISEARLRVGYGELSVTGRYDLAGGGFDLQLASSLDPNLFLPMLPGTIKNALRDFRVLAPPRISARYVLSAETGITPILQGRMEFGALELRTVPFRSVVFSFENHGPLVKISDAKIVMAEGQLTGHGQYHIETSDFQYELDSTLDPCKLLPLMFPGPRQIVEPAWFESAPHIVAAVSGDFVDPDAFAYDATLTTGRCAYRGVAFNATTSQLKLRHNQLDVRNMLLRRYEGNISGNLFADFTTHRINFDLDITASPLETAPLLGPKAGEFMRTYRFGPRTVATAKGLMDLDAPSNSCWQAHVSNDGFAYWKLATDKVTADLVVTNNTLTIENFAADFYTGKLYGKAIFSLANDAAYRFDFVTERVAVHPLFTAIHSKPVKTTGFLTGQSSITGNGSNLASIKGDGKLTVEDGVLWEIPAFGVLSHILNDIAPGVGSAEATKATATFVIADEAFKTDDLKIDAGAFAITSHGKIGFDGKLDFRVQGQFLKNLPGINIVTWFLKNIFEYQIGGTVGNYSYRPVNLPKEIMPHTTGENNSPHE
ncbi:MAG: AsmA-like C-terminal region-containing protein [Verrucomicrobiota bacterium]